MVAGKDSAGREAFFRLEVPSGFFNPLLRILLTIRVLVLLVWWPRGWEAPQETGLAGIMPGCQARGLQAGASQDSVGLQD